MLVVSSQLGVKKEMELLKRENHERHQCLRIGSWKQYEMYSKTNKKLEDGQENFNFSFPLHGFEKISYDNLI